MPILIVWALLVVFGLFGMYSVSIFESFTITRVLRDEPTNYFYFYAHLEKVLLWIWLCILVYFIPLKWFRKSRYVIFLVTALLMWLLFTDIWTSFGQWSLRWLEIWWWTIQPWEFYMLWFVIFLADWLVRKKKLMSDHRYFLAFALIVVLWLFVFVLLPDFGTLMILWPVALLMFWYGWWRLYYILITTILWITGVLMASLQFSYVQDRLAYFFDSSVDQDHRWIWWQSRQALIAVGWWWWIGKWYGKWLQKFWYLPEAQSDFIFAAFSEEIWFVWNLALLALYFLLWWFVLIKLWSIDDEYYKLLAVWMISLILIQTLVNIWVNIKLLPLTWVTLPFISHGWSALIVNMIKVMLLYKILYKR